MKKTLILLLVLALLAGAALPAMAEGETLLSWEGFELQPLYYNIRQRETGDSSLKVYMRVINNTDTEFYMRLDSCWINDVPVEGSGILTCEANVDTGVESEKYCLFTPLDDGDACIKNPRTIKMGIALYDKDAKQDVLHETVVLDMSTLSGDVKVIATPEPTPKPDFKDLKEGAKGESVRRLQQALIDLGYLNDKADGAYGSRTESAVRVFREQNGMSTAGGATVEMQELLFSGQANRFTEPWIPLVIGAHCYWDPIPSVNTFFFKVEVTNTSATRTIRGYELKCYCTNVWGERIYNDPIYSQDNRKRIEPGQTVYSDNFNLGNYYSVDTVWVGISKIVFDDGEIREVDDVEYYSCVK